MLRTQQQVIDALCRLGDVGGPRTGWLLRTGGPVQTFDRDPFGPGFLSGLEERTTLMRRLQRLDSRKRALLVLWYTQEVPVTEIARRLGISRVHCYRLGRQALQEMIRPDGEHAVESAVG